MAGGLPRADGGTGSTTRRDDTRTRPGPTAPAPTGRHATHPTGDPPARWVPACLLRLRPRWPFAPRCAPSQRAQPNAPSQRAAPPANAPPPTRPANAPSRTRHRRFRAQPTRQAPSQRAQPTHTRSGSCAQPTPPANAPTERPQPTRPANAADHRTRARNRARATPQSRPANAAAVPQQLRCIALRRRAVNGHLVLVTAMQSYWSRLRAALRS